MSAELSDECRRLLEFQHGVIARWQIAGSGPDLSAAGCLLRCGRWRQLYRGVYASYTGTPPRECVVWAAVLRAGKGAALSHYTAAELDQLTDKPSDVIHVTIDHDRRIRLSGQRQEEPIPPIVIHRSEHIDRTRHPVRCPPRTRTEETIIDLTQVAASLDVAFGWLSAGCGRRLVTPQQLRSALAMRRNLRWRSEVLGAIDTIAAGVHSKLEYRYVRDVERAHQLPAATRQARAVRQSRSQYFDNLYAAFGVAVKLDGRAAHLIEDRWRDIHRDNDDASSGIITLRYSWADVAYQSCAVAAQVAAVLRLRSWSGRPASCGPHCTAAAKFGTPFCE
jgi:hypothetical protein